MFIFNKQIFPILCVCFVYDKLESSLLRKLYLVDREYDQVDRQLNTGVHYHL